MLTLAQKHSLITVWGTLTVGRGPPRTNIGICHECDDILANFISVIRPGLNIHLGMRFSRLYGANKLDVYLKWQKIIHCFVANTVSDLC